MNILVANLGSTSFKYRLYRFADGAESLVAQGGYQRVTDYGRAIDSCIEVLRASGHIAVPGELHGIGFKTVHGGDLTGCLIADENVERALLACADIAPAHNPTYAAGMRQFRKKFTGVPQVAVFETAFYQWMPDYARRYAVPQAWHSAGVRRYGFHGASHKFVAERSAELLGRPDIAAICRHLYEEGPRPVPGSPLRVISCHLGGSSSITSICDGIAVDTSMGLSPQSGLPQNNRVGDLDSAAMPFAQRRLGLSANEAERQLAEEGGLLGLSGVSSDLREIRAAALKGNRRAEMAIDVFVHAVRHWIGAFWLDQGGCEALVFTGGIGENNPWIREMICAGLCELGLIIDPEKNNAAHGETDLAADESRTRLLVIPANEELVVARETHRRLLAQAARGQVTGGTPAPRPASSLNPASRTATTPTLHHV
ncbi:MAG: acetate kinase [Opitutaceae bacterium]|nr:acetate kinase [Opitutaceae bacterium]